MIDEETVGPAPWVVRLVIGTYVVLSALVLVYVATG